MNTGANRGKLTVTGSLRRKLKLKSVSSLALVVLLCGLVGLYTLIESHAATPAASFEAEAGSLSANASSLADATASGAHAVKFNAAASGSTTKPDATNTGVPAGTALTTVNGNVTVMTAGTVIDGEYIKGFLVIKASNVTVRNTHVEGGTSSSVTAVIDVQSGTNVLLQDDTVTVAHPAAGIDGIHGSNFTVQRLDISGGVDGMKVDSNSTVENSYIHNLTYFASDPSQGGGPTHNDGIQILSGANILLQNNNLAENTTTDNSSVQVTQDFGAVTNLRINNNWMDGGGCTLNIAHKVQASLSVSASGNRFGHDQGFSNCPILISTKTTLTGSGNVWDVAPNAGAAVPIQQHD